VVEVKEVGKELAEPGGREDGGHARRNRGAMMRVAERSAYVLLNVWCVVCAAVEVLAVVYVAYLLLPSLYAHHPLIVVMAAVIALGAGIVTLRLSRKPYEEQVDTLLPPAKQRWPWSAFATSPHERDDE
jgi:hypothetical protein